MTNKNIYNFAKKIIKYERSLSGKGNLKTLIEIKKINKDLKIKNFKSGSKVFDWVVPNEWHVKDAYIETPSKKKICNFKENNLHLLGYSIKVNKYVSLEKLQRHLFSLKNQPNAIPYVTSYYKRNWGFCIKDSLRKKLKKGKYKIVINSKFKKGNLPYGELLIKGKSKKEILLSTYICHPEMANNETSGISVLTFIARWITKRNRNFSYRILFIPETIGSIAYINKNFDLLKKKIIAGFIITCVGDENKFSYIPSRHGNTLSDHVSMYILKKYTKKFKIYRWLDRGSDERQFCAPGVDLPVCSITRSKYGTYKEYHTSLDKLDKVVTSKGLNESYKMYLKVINFFEKNNTYESFYPKNLYFCEPHLSKKKLYPTVSTKKQSVFIRNLTNILSYCDGKNSIEKIAELTENSIKKTQLIIKLLKNKKLVN